MSAQTFRKAYEASLKAQILLLKLERKKLIRVLIEAKESIRLENERIKLGEWTPLNVLREAVRACADIEVEK